MLIVAQAPPSTETCHPTVVTNRIRPLPTVPTAAADVVELMNGSVFDSASVRAPKSWKPEAAL